MLISFVAAYLVLSILLGVYAGTKVHNVRDYVNAGRRLPMWVVFMMMFATWFGAETILGVPGTFVEENLGALISDPIGAGVCLILFGAVFAKRLYRKNLLTLGDFYRDTYSKPVEIVVSVAIALSYLGWVAAQITALGLVFNVLTQDAISMELGIVIGALVVALYTLAGGMWSVAVTTVVQMTIIVVGLIFVAFLVSLQTGGVAPVVAHAHAAGKFEFWPELEWIAILTFVAGFLTMAFGSIPQQDVFQRANSAKTENAAAWGSIWGGVLYLAFAVVPLFLAYSAFILTPEVAQATTEKDPQLVLPTFMMSHLPMYAQVIFFGALLSVIMSTASGTLLAPSVTISENILRELLPNGRNLTDRQFLLMMRLTVVVFAVLVTLYALWSLKAQTSIHSMVENAYKVTLVTALVPLFAGLYWKKASNFGAVSAIVAGVLVWLPLEFTYPDLAVPPHFLGFLVALVAMIVGSLMRPRVAA